ncbi:hypothetical protein [Kitasatospora sp. CB01950]|uniref:hypothetical protein n=1 Tax=Kitasatospora sp. CB01950 TaxID=1703930 RepID=UPI00093C460E|nr:hypothetical protein [Kitasatospora sp. CB01950]OKJ17057.1 hypothetical protein AMK19_02765 [Kitasatospora sp. CB01950]
MTARPLAVALLASLALLLPGSGPQPAVAASGTAPAPAALPAVQAPTSGAAPSAGSGSSASGSSASGPAAASAATPGAAPTSGGLPTPSRPPRPLSYPSRTPGPNDPCPPTLTPHVLMRCAAASNEPTLLKLDVTAGQDLVIIQVTSSLSGMLPRLSDPDGQQVQCDVRADTYSFGPARCPTTRAGTYTLRLFNFGDRSLPIALSYLPVLSTDACVTMKGTDTSLGNPTVYRGTLPVGMAGDCWVTDFATGDVVRRLSTDVSQSLFDATGRDVCAPGSPKVSGPDCTLAGTAPYRLVAQGTHVRGDDETYSVAMSRLSRPEGCPVVEPQAYGVAPDLTDATRCRILRVPADGHHLFRGTRDSGDTGGTLYRPDLSTLCPSGDCDLKAGDYLFTVPPSTYASPYAMVFRSAAETRGCTAGRDDQMASGASVGTFESAGKDICRTLPTASGQALYVLNGTPNGKTARYRVLDAAGVEQCHGFTVYDTYQVCQLTGAAPFRLTAEAQGPFNYRLLVQRVGETAGCTPWGASEYGTGSGLRTGLTGKPADGALEACFTVPADHPATELVGYQVEGADDDAELHLVDLSGHDFCAIAYLETCRPPVGEPYTAMLRNGLGLGKYTVVRRDATPSAVCDLPRSSGRVGAPSTVLTYESTLDAHCTAFDADRADLFQVSAHAATNSLYGMFSVLDADGKRLCLWSATDCRATGSTRYLAVAASPTVDASQTPSRLDVWRLATAAGWAPECAAHPVSADGFDQRSGVLSDDNPLYCAVLEMKPGQKVDVASVTDDFVNRPRLTVAGRENWATGDTAYKCTQDDASTGTNTACTYNGTTTGHAVLLLSPGRAHLPLAYTLQGARPGTGTERSGVPESISPAVLPAGGLAEITVHGTGLSLNTQFSLSGRIPPCGALAWRPLRVNATGTELVVRVNLDGACTGYDGNYDLLINGVPHKDGVPSPGYLPKALKVIAG